MRPSIICILSLITLSKIVDAGVIRRATCVKDGVEIPCVKVIENKDDFTYTNEEKKQMGRSWMKRNIPSSRQKGERKNWLFDDDDDNNDFWDSGMGDGIGSDKNDLGNGGFLWRDNDIDTGGSLWDHIFGGKDDIDDDNNDFWDSGMGDGIGGDKNDLGNGGNLWDNVLGNDNGDFGGLVGGSPGSGAGAGAPGGGAPGGNAPGGSGGFDGTFDLGDLLGGGGAPTGGAPTGGAPGGGAPGGGLDLGDLGGAPAGGAPGGAPGGNGGFDGTFDLGDLLGGGDASTGGSPGGGAPGGGLDLGDLGGAPAGGSTGSSGGFDGSFDMGDLLGGLGGLLGGSGGKTGGAGSGGINLGDLLGGGSSGGATSGGAPGGGIDLGGLGGAPAGGASPGAGAGAGASTGNTGAGSSTSSSGNLPIKPFTMTGFNGCSAQEKQILQNLIEDIKTYRAAGVYIVNNQNEDPNYQKIFTKYFKDPNTISQVQKVFGNVNNMESAEAYCSPSNDEPCMQNAMAYTYLYAKEFHVCPVFFKEAQFGTIDQHASEAASIVLHELTHCHGTDDYAYGEFDIDRLSADKASNNADTYRLFAMSSIYYLKEMKKAYNKNGENIDVLDDDYFERKIDFRDIPFTDVVINKKSKYVYSN
ncbi:hypothetical protein BCR32DRAFT_324030 [Anaeromyces robustus]|uniref:Lysine-specific metallo-endopeptidase domain-containing protein n=1 Tax=Anaeromyces robustus TaxID=1754192 RepID=A0A1Y1XR33_9FUNG|nr:hypothetical protein BCR32DRAFT_324030 [Anaeromyces robustus]|eukprot:ORX88212.1 hypothetical protein BCR32DRAFT_324030 [Anaeromyces robustus]